MIEAREKPFISLKFDLMFKKVFGDNKDKKPIKRLLKEILNITPKEVTILNSEIINRPYQDKRVYVDLMVELEDRTKIGAEINTDVNQDIINRNLYYLCKNIGADLKPKQHYNELAKHIQINFDYEGKHSKPIMNYKLINMDTSEILTDMIEVIKIDVAYYIKLCYNNDTEKLDSLTKFIGLFGVSSKEDARELC